MKILIDTHIFLWAIADPARISADKRKRLEQLTNTVYVSSITIAEIMIKSSIQKLKIEYDPLDAAKQSGFQFLNFRAEDALLLLNLPFHHKDPFDRMLIVQAIANDCYLMTDDSKFRAYECRLL
ncbi:MAG: PIN domain nuclease, a component of toxin-antitoxin system (PIN domain) [Candidatus Electronema aureum]|jgi:PIN domain nuclease of toxin-antitoxin system|uniref:PIN domain nuclease, a component of toxin-antitoxin system (PIN domain) n=1 Tax=Candidatus Electronema aureum TaxID=2005002 RepID=A0A521G4F2_9BACT|nr:MAG: PIN domain nuclease, a component of toxin-antitoxin system (PIN domain) [Candidatus Electronema aureum]